MYQTTTTAAATHIIIYLLLIKFRITIYYIEKKIPLKSTFDLKKDNIL